MKKILIVDDSTMTLSILKKSLYERFDDIEILTAINYKDGLKYILQYGSSIDIAIIDLHLPDSKDGAMINVIEANSIKSIVLSSILDTQSKDIIFSKSCIIDCIAKDGKKSIKSVVNAINREFKNEDKEILVVDDSLVQVKAAEKILKKMNLKVTTASDGVEALDIIENSGKVFSLVLTDYHMPKMDGMELTFRLRELFDKDELGIIVLSSDSASDVVSEFLKIGANDFINKPYSEIEVITRINSNLDLVDLFKETKELANRDFLTGLYNRRYFFESGNVIIEKAKRENKPLALAMFDIDKFKNINDTYGHDVGDITICEVKNILEKYLRNSDLVARFGGEEFCILIDNITFDDTKKLLEKIRLAFEENVFSINEVELNFTVSIGAFYGLNTNLEEMLKVADDGLYKCKNSGRNKVYIENLTDN